jgi:hypothetical protein
MRLNLQKRCGLQHLCIRSRVPAPPMLCGKRLMILASKYSILPDVYALESLFGDIEILYQLHALPFTGSVVQDTPTPATEDPVGPLARIDVPRLPSKSQSHAADMDTTHDAAPKVKPSRVRRRNTKYQVIFMHTYTRNRGFAIA